MFRVWVLALVILNLLSGHANAQAQPQSTCETSEKIAGDPAFKVVIRITGGHSASVQILPQNAASQTLEMSFEELPGQGESVIQFTPRKGVGLFLSGRRGNLSMSEKFWGDLVSASPFKKAYEKQYMGQNISATISCK